MRFLFLCCCVLWLLGCNPLQPGQPAKVLAQAPTDKKVDQPAQTALHSISQQLYIWQRVWTAEHATALAQSQADFSALRVLALQLHPTKTGPVWQLAQVDLAMLDADQRPVWLVVRLDGRLTQLTAVELQQKLTPLIQKWRQAGIQLQGVELDYDSARSQLAAYRLLLQQLKTSLPAELQLGITALPDWLQSADFAALLAEVDLLTLQLHSVLSPAQGLFDPSLARQWVQQLLTFQPKHFSLALPAYHSALIGAVDSTSPMQVESEVPLLQSGERHELWLDPRSLQQLLSWLEQQAPAGLASVVWFRMPLPSDRRAWPYSVLQAVVSGQPLQAQPLLQISGPPPQLQLTLQNTGNVPLTLPSQLQLQGTNCLSGDALQGYQLTAAPGIGGPDLNARGMKAPAQAATTNYQLQRLKPAQLAPGASVVLGWWHCQQLTITKGIADETHTTE
ncbi:MAG: DUF3142 domain-containing protein [Gammaproteobacteria bacterium]|jgi:hypothetical protein|nr:DUF3142 domain-containing protein [Gammaproteobacteria bacterium]MBU2427698.1 DUF3142 domain-containing protein [Gammaproteobacteria bacterium]